MTDEEKVEKENLRVEFEQLNLWNRHIETTLWTVGSIISAAAFIFLKKYILM